jgi:hypothetical protein
VEIPEGLHERGSALWGELTVGRKWDPAGVVLVGEACRMVDRLEQLDRLLRRDAEEWVRIVDVYNGGTRDVLLEIDDLLAESRQLQTTLLTTFMKLGLGKSEAVDTGRASKSDDLRAKRAARLANAAGQ